MESTPSPPPAPRRKSFIRSISAADALLYKSLSINRPIYTGPRERRSSITRRHYSPSGSV